MAVSLLLYYDKLYVKIIHGEGAKKKYLIILKNFC
jgi:hypothetical protein